MSDPISNQFDSVRFFSALDPYQWTVDNRPLQDLYNNLLKLSAAVDATIDAEHIIGMAIGMVARGYATDNKFVGQLTTPGGMILTMSHGFIIQSLPAEIGDLRTYPHIGLQQTAYTFPVFSAPVGVGQKICYMVQARKVAPSSSLSFYDTTNVNEPDVVKVGTVEFFVKAGPEISDASPDNFPPTDAGWLDILHVTTRTGDTELTEDSIELVNFFRDGEFFTRECSYIIDTHITAGGSSVISGITVNANNAMVFIDGVYQHPAYYTVDDESQITWNSTLPAGLIFDFIVFTGASGSSATSGPVATYAYEVETFIVGPGGTTSVGPTVGIDTNYAFTFINGVFSSDAIPSGSHLMTFSTTLPEGTVVDLVSTQGGLGSLPAGGLPGQVPIKTGTGSEWQYPVSQATVTTASIGGSNILSLTATTAFDETTELYEGKLIALTGAFAFTNPSFDANILLGTVSLQVRRAGDYNLLPGDLYNGVQVRYTAVGGTRLEVVSTSSGDATYSCSVAGSIDAILATTAKSSHTLVHNATYVLDKTPGVYPAANTTGIVSLQIDSSPAKPILRSDGGVLEKGDIISGTTLHVRYDSYLNAFILLTPASRAPMFRKDIRRQTVINGPYDLTARNDVQKYDLTTLSTGVTHGYTPNLIKKVTSGPNNNVAWQVQVGGSDNFYCSFAAGYDSKGPIEYIERLPQSQEFLVSGQPTTGLSNLQLVSIVQSSASESMVITTNVNHSFYPGDWIDISGITNTYAVMNGEYQVTTRNSNTQFTCRKFTDTDLTLNTFPSTVEISPIHFIYADRNSTTGEVTYGITRYRPIYIYRNKSNPGNLNTLMVQSGRHVFLIEDMKMYLGSGAAYSAVQRVFLGQVSIKYNSTANPPISYAYNGEYTMTVPVTSVVNRGNSGGARRAFNVLKHYIGTGLATAHIEVASHRYGMVGISNALSEYDIQAAPSFYAEDGSHVQGVLVNVLQMSHTYLRLGVDTSGAFGIHTADAFLYGSTSLSAWTTTDSPIGGVSLDIKIERKF